MNIEINYLGLVLAVVASMVVGFLWYSPILFGKQWQKLNGYTDEKLKAMQATAGKSYAASAIFALFNAYMLAHVMGLSENFYHYSAMMTGVTSAISMWFGFVMPTQGTHMLFSENKNWSLFALGTGFQLVSLIAMGLVLAMF